MEKIAFSYVQGLIEDEFGYTSLIELESIKGPLGIGIEQDLYFVQKRLSEVKKWFNGRVISSADYKNDDFINFRIAS